MTGVRYTIGFQAINAPAKPGMRRNALSLSVFADPMEFGWMEAGEPDRPSMS